MEKSHLQKVLLLVAALAALAFPVSCSPCNVGIDEVSLLRDGVAFLARRHRRRRTAAAPAAAAAAAPLMMTLRASRATRTLFVGYASGVEAVLLPSSGGEPTVQTLGVLPGVAPAGFWQWAVAAVAWIHADATFDATSQLTILTPDAHCFGAVGREAIVAANVALSNTTAFGAPHSVQLDFARRTVIWDFDVLDRSQRCAVSGRGTDLVRFCGAGGGASGRVYRIDTVRHADGAQPAWVQAQLADSFTESNATCIG